MRKFEVLRDKEEWEEVDFLSLKPDDIIRVIDTLADGREEVVVGEEGNHQWIVTRSPEPENGELMIEVEEYFT